MKYASEIAFARRAAETAGHNAKEMRTLGVTTMQKEDDSPVTRADEENERLLRELIEAQFPDDAIIGEEGTSKAGRSGRRWIIDPIDGTRDFVRGGRFWCVLIALEEDGEVVLGVAHFPMLAETYWATRGYGSFRNGERITVSNIDHLGSALLSPNGLYSSALKPYAAGMMAFVSRFGAIRSPGGALSAGMLAAGEIDVWFEGKAEIWDLAAFQVIIEEAGGRYFALDGSRRIDLGNAVACNPALEPEVRTFFGLVKQG